MKITKFIGLCLIAVSAVSCEKHEIEYMTTPISNDMAEIQLHYFVPVTATATNNIYKMEIGRQEYVNNGAAVVSTYNAVPSGSVGRFYTTAAGDVNIKLYKGTDLELVYDKNAKLTSGKQNVFVYDFDKDPIVFDNGYPYETNTTMDTDSTCWVKFYNFLYEKEGEYSTLKLQYQYQYTTKEGSKSEWKNIGSPIAFGESTGWQPITVIKSIFNSSGYARIDYKIKVQDENGEYTQDLQVWNSNGKYVSYSDYWNGYIGRRYHHILKGMRSAKPISSVSQFTAL
ncbi:MULTISPECIES: hypothetical protein [Bacteroides]|jgi:hypothetical protein|uniref:hypothetical protein n=1 Tax=Bacteroides TaxID=816 RepID=UPI000E494FF4|nr:MULTISPECIES: hypothetical protein [Bacteroides]RHL12752.1 hypothetical protein DW036_01415 [Bacteroides sp. AF39-11AC]